MTRSRSAVVLAVAVTVMLASCGDNGDGDYGGAPPPATRPVPAATGSAGTPPGQPTTVTVMLVDFEIQMSETPTTAGTYRFVVEHDTGAPHALAIRGPGVDESTRTLRSGQGQELTVDLGPGTYELWCPVGAHRGMGMETTIEIS